MSVITVAMAHVHAQGASNADLHDAVQQLGDFVGGQVSARHNSMLRFDVQVSGQCNGCAYMLPSVLRFISPLGSVCRLLCASSLETGSAVTKAARDSGGRTGSS